MQGFEYTANSFLLHISASVTGPVYCWTTPIASKLAEMELVFFLKNRWKEYVQNPASFHIVPKQQNSLSAFQKLLQITKNDSTASILWTATSMVRVLVEGMEMCFK